MGLELAATAASPTSSALHTCAADALILESSSTAVNQSPTATQMKSKSPANVISSSPLPALERPSASDEDCTSPVPPHLRQREGDAGKSEAGGTAEGLAEAFVGSPVEASVAMARPPRPVRRRVPREQAKDFPADEVVDAMSRRERIALMEGMADTTSDAGAAEPRPHRQLQGGGSRCRRISDEGASSFPSAEVHNTELSRRDRIAMLEKGCASGDSCPGRSDSLLLREPDDWGEIDKRSSACGGEMNAIETPRGRRNRLPLRDEGDRCTPRRHERLREPDNRAGLEGPLDSLEVLMTHRDSRTGEHPAAVQASDEGDLHRGGSSCSKPGVSRINRLTSLERACHGNEGTMSAEVMPTPRRAPRRRDEEASAQRRVCSESRAHAGSHAASMHSSCPEADDDHLTVAWLEQRRQKRKQRLQKKSGAIRAPLCGSDAAPAAKLDLLGLAEARLLPGKSQRSTVGTALGNTAVEATGGGGAAKPPADELEELLHLEAGSAAWSHACSSLAKGAHKWPCSGLIRAAEVLVDSAASPTGSTVAAVAGGEQAMEALRELSKSLLSALTPQLGTLGSGPVTKALRMMAVGKVDEQTYLDVLLSRLLVTLRHDRASFTKSMLVSIAGALGTLHETGISAKRASSGASSAANKRCIEALAEQIVTGIEDFGEEDLARMGGSFLVAFLDDLHRRAFLRRAADLHAGLQTTPGSWLAESMQGMEKTLRKHSFAFIAGLPDQTKDYLMRLKMASDHASKSSA